MNPSLRKAIVDSLIEQGFVIDGTKSLPPETLDKAQVRSLHQAAVTHRRAKAKPALIKHEDALLQRWANGDEVSPQLITPKLIEVRRHSADELLFRYTCLHWSIPVSAGYGRRIRFLVIDEQNDKLMGVIGLSDPVFSLGPRDRWIGWTDSDRRERLYAVMDAFVIGAVPPYSQLLCSKLIAMLAVSDEVTERFRDKYAGRQSRISGRVLPGDLALVTTISALGRSSVYNRLRYNGDSLFESVGFTRGSGDFHFSNGLYEAILEFARQQGIVTSKRPEWGGGFRNKREVIKKSLIKLGISSEWIYHGVRREIFVAPTATNAREYLQGNHEHLHRNDRPVNTLFTAFRQRWLLPRAERDPSYKSICCETFRLWPTEPRALTPADVDEHR
jgi:Domain of unknown function (DUF4338)